LIGTKIGDLEWRNGFSLCYSEFSIAFVANYVKVVDSTDFLQRNVTKYTN